MAEADDDARFGKRIDALRPNRLGREEAVVTFRVVPGLPLPAGTTGIAASYSTTFNVMPSVPEPQSYAMFLGGLALMTMMMRRRRQRA